MNTRTPRPRSLLSLLAGAALGLPLLACDGVEDQDATIAADSEDVEESEVGEDSADSEDVVGKTPERVH